MRLAQRVDVAHLAAMDARQAGDAGLEQRGLVPDVETQARIPAIQKEKVNVATKVQDARVLYEMDKIPEAKAILKEAIKANLSRWFSPVSRDSAPPIESPAMAR